MTESKISVSTRELQEAQKIQTWILSVKEIINTAVEQGLWVAIMIDMLGIAGRVKYGSFLGEQRRQLIKVLDKLSDKDLITNFLDIGNIPNPGYYIFGWLRPLKDELSKTSVVMESPGPGYGEYPIKYYREVDPIPKIILVFVFPGALRLLAAQVGEIIPG